MYLKSATLFFTIFLLNYMAVLPTFHTEYNVLLSLHQAFWISYEDAFVLCKQKVQRNAEKSAEACSYLFKSRF
ncbi:hypothetical protein BK773_22085 [Bacillus thuringiensis serovar indiana]|nr:hypothetical protein BK773_22085 [Bacillus thuringiensis serovar indiana]